MRRKKGAGFIKSLQKTINFSLAFYVIAFLFLFLIFKKVFASPIPRQEKRPILTVTPIPTSTPAPTPTFTPTPIPTPRVIYIVVTATPTFTPTPSPTPYVVYIKEKCPTPTPCPDPTPCPAVASPGQVCIYGEGLKEIYINGQGIALPYCFTISPGVWDYTLRVVR